MALQDVPFKASSNVAAAQWDSETLDFVVTFNHGGVYVYKSVPENEVNAFSQAISAGKYLNEFIKPVYRFERG